jgi:hypothetical protein
VLRASLAGLAALSLLLVAALGGCGSVPDITFDDVDGGADTGSADASCIATGPEICGDGVDNDCNAKTDCADPACASRYACVTGLPADWQAVAFAEGARPPCPDGFGAGVDVRTVQGAAGAPSCTCDCGGSCSAGSVGLAFGRTASCGDSSASLAVTSGCGRLGTDAFTVASSAYVKVTPPTTPTCNANPSATVTPLRDGRVCSPTGKAAGGCSAASSCLPVVGAGYQLCVEKSGDNPCPSGFPSARRAGTSATDTRTCSACSCKASPCAVEVTLHEASGCGTAELTALSSAGCAQGSNNAAFTARGYETRVSGGCETASAPTPGGSLTLQGQSTICCRSTN